MNLLLQGLAVVAILWWLGPVLLNLLTLAALVWIIVCFAEVMRCP